MYKNTAATCCFYDGKERISMGAVFLPGVYGQEKIKNELFYLMEEGKLPHTMIFYGEEGLGKTTAAWELAGALTGDTMAAGRWAALKEEEPSQTEPVVTAVEDRIWYLRPVGMELKMSQFRLYLEAEASFDESIHVCIIDEAQTMMEPAANALLKTLEEPEEQEYFILITHDLEALLPTILSRSARFPFVPLPEMEYMHFLHDHDSRFPFQTDEERAQAFQLSEGNPGLTADLFSQEGLPQPESAMVFWETLTWSRTPFSDIVSRMPQERKEFMKALRWIILIGRDLMILSADIDSPLVRCQQVADREKELSSKWTGDKAAAALEVLEEAGQACRRYISVKSIWDRICITLLHIQKG